MDVRCGAPILSRHDLLGLFCTQRLDNYGSWCDCSDVGHFGIACSSAATAESIPDGVQLLGAFGYDGYEIWTFLSSWYDCYDRSTV